MTLSIQQQIDRNREILRQLPVHANFVRVWDPQFLSHSLPDRLPGRGHGYGHSEPRRGVTVNKDLRAAHAHACYH